MENVNQNRMQYFANHLKSFVSNLSFYYFQSNITFKWFANNCIFFKFTFYTAFLCFCFWLQTLVKAFPSAFKEIMVKNNIWFKKKCACLFVYMHIEKYGGHLIIKTEHSIRFHKISHVFEPIYVISSGVCCCSLYIYYTIYIVHIFCIFEHEP